MGDCGALALGFLLASVAVQGVIKTAAVIALMAPLLVVAVPILDTSFVVLKRLKYRRRPWAADHNHFYHRFMRIGFSQKRTAAYLHVWAALLATFASLEELYDGLDRVGSLPIRGASKLADRLREHRDAAYFARRLTVIACDMPIEFSMESLRRRKPDLDGLGAFYDQQKFGAALRRQAERLSNGAPLG